MQDTVKSLLTAGISHGLIHYSGSALHWRSQHKAVERIRARGAALPRRSNFTFRERQVEMLYKTNSGVSFDKYGAGCVNAQGAYYVLNGSRCVSANFGANTTEGLTRNYSFNVSSTDTRIRVSLSWLKYSTVSGSATHISATSTLGRLADLDLKVYDKNGAQVDYANSATNNTEIVEFTPNTALNPYRIEITQYHNSDKIVYYTLSWY